MSILAIAGLGLAAIGLLVTVLFWVPQLVNRVKLKELLGNRYRVIYLIYIANGPILVVLGALLYYVFGVAPAGK